MPFPAGDAAREWDASRVGVPRARRPLWREPLAYLVAPTFGAGMWVGIGELLDPDVPWTEQALTGGAFGLVMVLVVGFTDWRRQQRP